MEAEDILALIHQAEGQIIQLSEEVSQIKAACSQLIAENNQLRMANHELRDWVQQGQPSKVADPEDPGDPGSGRQRLQSFYDEGIHICHPYFGTQRLPNEACIFCQGILDGLEGKDDHASIEPRT